MSSEKYYSMSLPTLLENSKIFTRIQRHLFNHGFFWRNTGVKKVFVPTSGPTKYFIFCPSTKEMGYSMLHYPLQYTWLTIEEFFKLDLNKGVKEKKND